LVEIVTSWRRKRLSPGTQRRLLPALLAVQTMGDVLDHKRRRPCGKTIKKTTSAPVATRPVNECRGPKGSKPCHRVNGLIFGRNIQAQVDPACNNLIVIDDL